MKPRTAVAYIRDSDAPEDVLNQWRQCLKICTRRGLRITALAQKGGDQALYGAVRQVESGEVDTLVAAHPKELGSHLEAVEAMLPDGGLVFARQQRKAKPRRELSAVVVGLHRQGVSVAAIATALDMPVAAVEELLRRPRGRAALLLAAFTAGASAVWLRLRRHVPRTAKTAAVAVAVVAAMWAGAPQVQPPPAPSTPWVAPAPAEPPAPPEPTPATPDPHDPSSGTPTSTPQPTPSAPDAEDPDVEEQRRRCLRPGRLAVDVPTCLERAKDLLSRLR